MNNILKKIVAIATIASSLVMMAGPAVAITIEELETQIADLLATLTSLQTQLAELKGETPTVTGCTITSFDRNLSVGMTGDDVKCLQIVLNSATDTQLADSGVGSSGNETSYFGPLTKAAVIKFQEKYASEVLASWGLTAGTGYVGSTTRAKLNVILGGIPAGCDCTAWVAGACVAGMRTYTRTCTPAACALESKSETDATCAVAAGLTVALSANTPASATVPANDTTAAANVPVTKVDFTAGSEAVTVTGLKVERTGLCLDAAISSVKLFDGSVQVGTSQSLGSTHKASFSSISIEIPANTTKTITLAASLTAETDYSGSVFKLSIGSASDITTTADITGTFPIIGNSMTTNSATTIGTAIMYNGAEGTRNTSDLTVDPSDVDVRFTQVKITAGSAEGLVVNQITAVKNGTAASADVKDIKLVNDTSGVTLGTVASLDADGRAVFSDLGVSVAKGASVELSVLATMDGGSGRTITFDLHDGVSYTTDITGASYGFGITPTVANNGFCDNTSGSGVGTTCQAQSINQGYLTCQLSASTPATGNIALGGSEIELFAMDCTAYGEAINVTSTVIVLTPAGDGSGSDWTNVVGYDGDGNALFGPQDADTGANAADTMTFTDAYTLPMGTTTIYVKGNLSSSAEADETVVISLTAGTITAKGASSGKTTYTTSSGTTVPPAAAITGKTQTILGPATAVVTAAVPVAGNIVLNAQDAIFAYFDLDCSASGEDVKVTTIVTTDTVTGGTGAYTGVNNLELWDGDTRLETTSSTATNAATVTFTLKVPLRITAGTSKRLTLKADVVNRTASTTHQFKIANTTDHVISTGYGTGTAVTETYSGSGQVQTISAAGTLQVTVSADRAAAAQFVAGTTGNSMMTYRLYANYENIDITAFYIATTGTTAKADIDNVKVYFDGEIIGNPAGYALDSGGDALVSLSSGTMVVKKSTYHTLALKADLVDKINLEENATLEIGLGTGDSYDDTDWGASGAYSTAESCSGDTSNSYCYYYMTATGVGSGDTVTRETINSTGVTTTGVVAASYVHRLHDGVLVVSLNSASPSGSATPGGNKEVLRLDLQAVGDDIEINEMELCVAGTAAVTGTGSFTIKSSDLGTTYATVTSGDSESYWDTVIGSADYYIMDPGTTNASCISIGDNGGYTAGSNMVDFSTTIEISAGTTKTLRMFGDTTGADSTKILQLSLQPNSSSTYRATTSGIEWQNNDGEDIDNTLSKNLPVTGGSLTY